MTGTVRKYASLLTVLLLIAMIPGSLSEGQSDTPLVPAAERTVTFDRADIKTHVQPGINVSGQLLSLTSMTDRNAMLNQAAQTNLQLTARGVRTTVIAATEADALRLVTELQNLGASDIQRYKRWIDATIPVSSLEIAGQLPGLSLVQPVIQAFPSQQEPVTIGGSDTTTVSGNQAQVGQPATASNSPSVSTLPDNSPTVNTGTYTSAGVAASNADAWHSAGITGNGVVVGVLDAFAGLSAAQSSGDLPSGARISTIGTLSTSSTHGTAVAEIIYDMAPGVDFLLGSPSTAVEIANMMTQMAQQGVNVISSSLVVFNTEPGDGTGPISDAITNVTNTYDVLVVQAAGNQAVQNWQGEFDDSNNNGYHDFPNGDEINRIYAEAGTTISLFMRWNSWPTTNQDYDILLFREDSSVAGGLARVGTGGNLFQDGDDPPTEQITFTADRNAYYGWTISEYKTSGDPEIIDVMAYQTPSFEKNIGSYSLVDGSTSSAVVGVAAVDATSPYNRPIYSSIGPAMAAGGDLAPGNQQPRLAGYTNVDTYTTQQSSQTFDGTSAAAPHVAGAAALIRGNFPGYSVATVKTYLESNAIDMGQTGYDYIFGAGRLGLGTPPVANLVANGSFTSGMDNWDVFGDIIFSVNNGVITMGREIPGWRVATLYQNISTPVSNNEPLRLELDVGNTSSQPQGIEVEIRDSNRSQSIVCTFDIPANTPLTAISVADYTTSNWSGITAVIRSPDPDASADLQIDNVRLVSDSLQSTGLACDGMDTQANTNIIDNSGFDLGIRYWGLWSLAGDMEYRVQNQVMEFYGQSNTISNTVAFQFPSGNLKAGMPVELSLELGNSSNVDKTVDVFLRSTNWSQVIGLCTYTIPAGSSLKTVQVRDTVASQWGQAVVHIRLQESDDAGWLRVDNVSMHYDPALDTTSTCSSSYAPASTAAVNSPKTDAVPLPEVQSLPPEAPESGAGSGSGSAPVNGMPSIPES